MSQKANPTMVGLFILLGLALAVGSVVLFGSLRWFSPTCTFIVYFQESAAGLDTGSAVRLRGVRVGQVKEVMIHFNQATDDLYLPVLVEIDKRALHAKVDRPFDFTRPEEVARAIQNGLRAKLELESFVTGRLYVDLAFDTNAPLPVYHQEQPLYMEIPSQATELAQLKRNLAQVDIIGIAEKIVSLLDKVNRTVDQLQVARLSEAALKTLQQLEQLTGSAEVTNTVASLRRTAEQVRQLAAKMDHQVDPLATDARETLAQASQSLSEFRQAVTDLRGLMAGRSSLRTDLNATLASLSDAAEAVTALAEFLRRHPQALISGRQLPSDTR